MPDSETGASTYCEKRGSDKITRIRRIISLEYDILLSICNLNN